MENKDKAIDYKELSFYATRDISKLSKIVNFIREIENTQVSEILDRAYTENVNCKSKILLLQTSLYTLFTNPFDFNAIIKEEDRYLIFKFVTENILKEKLTIKICVKIYDLEFILKNTKFNLFVLLKEISKIRKLDKKFLEICLCKKSINSSQENLLHKKLEDEKLEDEKLENNISENSKLEDEKLENNISENSKLEDEKLENNISENSKLEDDITTLICKLKIVSHQYKYYPELITLNFFFQYLNYNNFKLGYSLCRSLLRIVKYFNIEEITDHVQNQMKELFANEILWINSFHILGSICFTTKTNIQVSHDIIETGLFYNKDDVNYRSALVREYTLFLIYSLLRNNHSDYLINLLIYTCIFDNNLKIRGIAASILSTHFNLEIKVKRNEDLLEAYDKINNIYGIQIEKYINNPVTDINVLDVRNHIIAKYNLIHNNKYDSSVIGLIDMGFNVKYSLIYNNNILLDWLKTDISRNFRYRFSDKLIDLYIEVILFILTNKIPFKEDKVIDNIIFILSKNIKNQGVYKIIWMLDNKSIYEYLFKNRKKTNPNTIISNFKNPKYQNIIFKEYKEIIKVNSNIEYIAYIYKGINYINNDISYWKDEILLGLENYLINNRGDVCYEIRLECLKLVRFDREIFNKYLVRYLVDKNKFIRDYLRKNLHNYKDVIDNYQYLLDNINSIDSKFILKFDGVNITIGLLGYLATSDNYEYNDILNIFINNLSVFDKFIREIIKIKYERVYIYILKLIVNLLDSESINVDLKYYSKEWLELLREYDTVKYEYIIKKLE